MKTHQGPADAKVPFDPGTGPMPGYVAGRCGHRVAESEWDAGFRTCERCPDVTDAPAGTARIDRKQLVTELIYNPDFVVSATRIVVRHRTAGRIELVEAAAGRWTVVDPATGMAFNCTDADFQDQAGDDIARYLMHLEEAQQCAFDILRDRLADARISEGG